MQSDRRREWFRRSTPAGAVIAAALLATGIAACGSSGGSGGSASGTTAADGKSFYDGKTITWDVPDPPGTGFYTTATILAPALGKYLNATVNIVSIPAGGTIAGQDQAAAAPADGLTIGVINASTDVANEATKQPDVNFDMQKEELIAGLPINPEVFVVQPSSPYKAWQDLVAAGGLKSVAVTGSNEVLEKGIYTGYGINAQLIAGYEAPPDEVAGFLRGDALLGANSVPTFASAVAAGKARALLVTGPVLAGMSGYAQLKSVPTLAKIAQDNPPKTAAQQAAIKAMEALFGQAAVNQVYFCPPGTPASLVSALSAAFKAITSEASVKAAFIKQNLTPGYLSQSQVTAAVKSDLAQEPAIAAAAGNYQG
ncbi:MAG TPA: tripartite tricarboxylate transporter substrate-binding protein [Trebonia sp.]|jgi:tripartite-type tricarboxylate transporter receptor subunit TctC|nr:tripartite tricarboxylate transporter substrate-binding protein [Trebonia sp.]